MDSDDEYEYDTGEDYTYEDDEDNQDALSSDDNDLKSDSMLVDTSSNKIGSSTSPPLSNSEPNSDSKRKSSGKVIPKLKIPDGSYFISEYSSILQIMDGLITEVAALLDLNVDASQILLYHMKWNKERLTDAFFSSSEKLLDDCGLDISLKPVINSIASSGTAAIGTATPTRRVGGPMMPSQGASIDSGNDTFCCRICCDTCPVYDAFSLSCNHAFCVPCYTEYLRMQVNEGPACVQAHCAQHKCRQAITRSVFERFLGTAYPESLEKYKVHVLRNFIEMTKGLQYCPAPGCDKVAVGLGVCTVRCNCGCVFCCKCGEEAHEPCICSQLTDWMTKCSNESETANWILANTKKCPKCNARIEKNQGCNHMNCKLCKFEFCWICMGPWVDHGQGTGGYYKCNRYETSADSSATAAQRAKHELDRYLHYYQRYHGHDQALKFAASHRQSAERRMVERQESQREAWIDVQFLRQAVEQVIDCRRVLKYTYALGYFLQDGSPEKHLFEHQQEMLEKNTERLQEFTEMDILAVERTQVVNLTRVTERFMNELLATTEGGVVDSSSTMMLSSSPANLSSFLSSSPGASLGYMTHAATSSSSIGDVGVASASASSAGPTLLAPSKSSSRSAGQPSPSVAESTRPPSGNGAKVARVTRSKAK